MIEWITVELASAVHERQLSEHGGQPGVRDIRLLESALARPAQLYAYGDPPPDLAALATSLAAGIAKNHPFLDGNKRTAHVCYRLFLELNGAVMTADVVQKYAMIYGLAAGTVSETEFEEWLRSVVRIIPSNRVQEPDQPGYDVQGDAA